jgi:large subunit ribosomal protein L37Ae
MAKDLPKSVKRFGSRYGRRLRLKFGLIERVQRAKHKCPYCGYVKATWMSVGIWQCEKCNAKFSGKAYKV